MYIYCDDLSLSLSLSLPPLPLSLPSLPPSLSLSLQVSKLCDLDDDRNTVTSVSWSEKGHHLAIGTHKGYVQIWDAANMKHTHTLTGHSGRVGE